MENCLERQWDERNSSKIGLIDIERCTKEIYFKNILSERAAGRRALVNITESKEICQKIKRSRSKNLHCLSAGCGQHPSPHPVIGKLQTA